MEGEAEAPNLLAEVAKVVTVVHCGGNDLVFAQGDEGHSFYVIYSGVVSIRVETKSSTRLQCERIRMF